MSLSDMPVDSEEKEIKFKHTAKRNQLLGLWAADQLGLEGAEAQVYAKSVVMADFEEAGDSDVIRKICRDFNGFNISLVEIDVKEQIKLIEERLIEKMRF